MVFKIQNLFKFLIEDFLGKSLTFSGRTYIWERAIYWIKKSWLYGYGYERASLHQLKTIFPYCHNILLEHMYQGGIILIICLLLIQVCFGKYLMAYATNYYAKVITISVFILYFMMMFETLSMIRVFPLFLLAYHIEQIMACDKKSKEERQGYLNERVNFSHCAGF
jgi:O-antigen ligase